MDGWIDSNPIGIGDDTTPSVSAHSLALLQLGRGVSPNVVLSKPSSENQATFFETAFVLVSGVGVQLVIRIQLGDGKRNMVSLKVSHVNSVFHLFETWTVSPLGGEGVWGCGPIRAMMPHPPHANHHTTNHHHWCCGGRGWFGYFVRTNSARCVS
jgi:hypothetical protein